MSRPILNIACVWRLVSIVALLAAGGLEAQERQASAVKAYDIPPQALDRALSDYINASGAQVLYETEIAFGHRSLGVKGDFTPEAALATLLAGTGLVAMRTDIDAFIISPASADVVDPSASGSRPNVQFLSALQTSVLQVLCANSNTRPGGYKIGLELWIAPDGTIRQSALFGSTGDSARDALLTDTLRGRIVSVGPPPNLPQPIILTIAPRSPRQTGDCPD